MQNYHALYYFLRVAQAGSLRKAARELGITNGTLKRQMDLLEESLGAILFERSGQGCVLTPASRLLAERLEQRFASLDEDLSEFQARPSTSLRIGVSRAHFLLDQYTGATFASFLNQHSSIEETTISMESSAFAQALLDKEMDAALVHGEVPLDPRFASLLLLEQPFCLVLPPLGVLPFDSVECLQDLQGLHLIYDNSGLCLPLSAVQESLAFLGLELKVKSEGTPLKMLAEVMDGKAFTLVPELLAHHWTRSIPMPEFRIYRLSGLELRQRLSLVWKRTQVSPALRELLDFLNGLGLPRDYRKGLPCPEFPEMELAQASLLSE